MGNGGLGRVYACKYMHTCMLACTVSCTAGDLALADAENAKRSGAERSDAMRCDAMRSGAKCIPQCNMKRREVSCCGVAWRGVACSE